MTPNMTDTVDLNLVSRLSHCSTTEIETQLSGWFADYRSEWIKRTPSRRAAEPDPLATFRGVLTEAERAGKDRKSVLDAIRKFKAESAVFASDAAAPTYSASPERCVSAAMSADPTLARRIVAAFALDRQGLRAEPITKAEEAAEVLRPLLAGHETERLAVIALDARHRVIAVETLTVGTAGFTIVDPKTVVRWALRLDRPAIGIILGHNHPSNDPTPSYQDKVVTEQIRAACKTVGIRLLDHLIIAGEGFVSFSNEGLLPAFVAEGPSVLV